MDEKLTGFITKEYSIGNVKIAPIDILLIVMTVVFGVLMRSKVFMIYSPKEADGYSIFGDFIDAMKIVSGIGDIMLAGITGACVWQFTKKKTRAFLTFSIVYLSPVMAADSAMWGMGDCIWLSFVMLTVIFLISQNTVIAAVCFAIAALLHPYTLFVLPVLLGVLCKKKSGYPAAGLIAAGSVVSLLLGMNPYMEFPPAQFERILLESRYERLLSYNGISIYQLFGPGAFVSEYEKAGYILCTVAAIVVFLFVMSYTDILYGCMVASLLIPYIAPGLHERAGIMGMLFTLCYAMKYPHYYYIAVAEMILAFIPTAAYFREESFIPLSVWSLAQMFIILYLICAKGVRHEASGKA